MNNIYIYNNDLFSLLTLINYLVENNIKPDDIKTNDYSTTLLDNIINLNLESNDFLVKTINKIILTLIIDTYLSNEKYKEIIIYYFYKNYKKYGINVINMYNLKCVYKVRKISNYVKHEAHKYKGFVRFKELENKVLYAEIEPINNVLILISNHFKTRLKNEYFIIKDKKHGILSIYDKKKLYIINENEFILNTNKLSENEKNYQMMWKTFYNTIGIESRNNDRCRMNFMPKRYWKYLIEMSDINEENN